MESKHLNYSKLLIHLIDMAEEMGNPDRPFLTTANLMLGAVETCCIHKDSSIKIYDREEVLATEKLLSTPSFDPDQLRTRLKDPAYSDSVNRRSEAFLVREMLYKAAQVAAKNGDKVLRADTALRYIIDHPSAAFRGDASKMEKLSTLIGDARDLRRKLTEQIYGQDRAIQTMVTGHFQTEFFDLTEKERHRPKALYLFAGPPGVGKTYLAQTTAEALGLEWKRFNMSDYSHHEATVDFAGSNQVYRNATPGYVTKYVDDHQNETVILLFDEIEKAHANIITLFLQILDAGKLRDNCMNKDVSFENTILIFTTNAGRQLYQNSETGNFTEVPQKTILKALETDIDPQTKNPYFPPELCSRFATGYVVMFNYLDAHDLIRIVEKGIRNKAKNYKSTFGISLDVDSSVYSAILFSEGGAADARTTQSRAETFLQDEIYELSRLTDRKENDPGSDRIRTIHITAEIPEEGEIRELFVSESQQELLLLAEEKVVGALRRKCPAKSSPYHINGRKTFDGAKRLLSKGAVRLLLVDPACGLREEMESRLNLEDIDSEARDLLRYVREQYRDIPVYLLNTTSYSVDEEEMASFRRNGIAGLLDLTSPDFARNLRDLSEQLHQQDSMRSLARSNRIVTYETGQAQPARGSDAYISLFDFALKTAVDPDEAENILSDLSRPDFGFDKVIGAGDAVQTLRDFAADLQNPQRYREMGISAPKGVLLYGPPGTGKTLLAKAFAHETDMTFIGVEGNRFQSQYTGKGPEKVHEYFRMARKYAPTILFIDEVDVIARIRGGGSETGDILTALLTEMDGFNTDPSRPVFVLAATNFLGSGPSDSLDPALLRRFDERIYVGLPDKAARMEYLSGKIDKNPFFAVSSKMKNNIAIRSVGLSLARLEQVLNLSMRLSIREGCDKVLDRHLDEALEKQLYGDQKKKKGDDELRRTARHEAGHAYLHWLSHDIPDYITIVARSGFGGYVINSREGKGLYTRNDLLNDIRCSLGGRAAEIVYYGKEGGISTGIGQDIRDATRMAQMMVCDYAMDARTGLAAFFDSDDKPAEPDANMRKRINAILEEQMQEAVRAIREGRKQVNKIVDMLIEKNRITGEELVELLGENES